MKGRYGHRDATLILVAYRHGLRAVELCDLEWSQVEFERAATLHVRRAQNGKPAAHPIRGDELRALRELRRHTGGGYVFETEHGLAVSRRSGAAVAIFSYAAISRGLWSLKSRH